MNHSATIFGFLIVAFLIFVTMRGDLPKYIRILL